MALTVFAVLAGLLIVAFCAAWKFWWPVAPLARAIVHRTSPRLRARLSKNVPEELRLLDLSRAEISTERRLEHIQKIRKPSFIVVGGVYLDIYVKPVPVAMDGSEHSELQQVELRCGGSAVFVGRYVRKLYGLNSYLYTALGGGDILSKELKQLLGKESWIKRPPLRGGTCPEIPDCQSGVSVQLFHDRQLFRDRQLDRTTFTHKGALSNLSWYGIVEKIRRYSPAGGVVHISGYFRTNLGNGLCDALARLPAGMLVCVDHGRFVPKDAEEISLALLDSFQQRLVDVYICTLPELAQLMAVKGCAFNIEQDIETQLQECYSQKLLPPITVVRQDLPGNISRAYVVFEGRAAPVTDVNTMTDAARLVVGRHGAFNAGLMAELCRKLPRQGARRRDSIEDATCTALMRWASLKENDA